MYLKTQTRSNIPLFFFIEKIKNSLNWKMTAHLQVVLYKCFLLEIFTFSFHMEKFLFF